MNTMFQGIKNFVREEDGAAGIEYALLLAFVALVMVAAATTVKDSVRTIWTSINTALAGAAAP
ncbi:Flp family type IVb pilin [Cupriavidus sp. BIC8F]|uniref:Flp family type IVb pilin n=1 Tax=Cupriavidus sp. BIC8F TaxID=3079014 RepID=UPI00396715AA